MTDIVATALPQELMGSNGASVIIPSTMGGGASMSGAMSPALSGQEAMEESQVGFGVSFPVVLSCKQHL